MKFIHLGDIDICSDYGSEVRIVASIEDLVMIRIVRARLDKKVFFWQAACLLESRAPSAAGQIVQSN